VTCVAGLAEKGRVWIGADSAGVGGLSLTVRADSKVFRRGPFVMGFTTSFRMGQLLRYRLTIPEHRPNIEVEQWMATEFVDAVRECLKAGGFARKKDEEETGGTFLVGYRGQLFAVHEDYQVGEPLDGFDAVGSGAELARGALFATRGRAPRRRIEIALQAAERMNAGVRGPFHIEIAK